MTVREETARLTLKTENGICGVKMKYPVFENCKIAKDLNLFFDKVRKDYIQYAKEASHGGEIFSFDTPSVYSAYGLCSLFFEKTVKKGRYITHYSPFSLTFSHSSGKPLSLISVCPSCAETYTKIRKSASEYGVKISHRQFLRRFYVSENGIIVYFSVFKPESEMRQSCECVKKIYLSNGSIPNFSSTVRK